MKARIALAAIVVAFFVITILGSPRMTDPDWQPPSGLVPRTDCSIDCGAGQWEDHIDRTIARELIAEEQE